MMKEGIEHCAKCGKSITAVGGRSFGGMTIQVKDYKSWGQDSFTTEFLQEQMGKYELNKAYHICYECLLDSMLGGTKG